MRSPGCGLRAHRRRGARITIQPELPAGIEPANTLLLAELGWMQLAFGALDDAPVLPGDGIPRKDAVCLRSGARTEEPAPELPVGARRADRSQGDDREATRAFLELSGSWADERSAREIVSSLRKARRSRKRFR